MERMRFRSGRRAASSALLVGALVAVSAPAALLQQAAAAPSSPTAVAGAQVRSPAGVVGRGGEVVVASGDGGDVVAVQGGQQRVLGAGLPRGRFTNGPTGVVLNANGDVFVASADEGTVHVLRRAGGAGVYAAGLGSPVGLAFSSTGDLYVADAAGKRVLRVAPDSAVYRVAEGFAQAPFGVAFSPNGDLFVSTQRDGRIFRVRVIHLTGLPQVRALAMAGLRGEIQARRVPSFPGRGGRSALRLGVGDEAAVAHGFVGDGELQQAVEDHASAA